MINSDFNQKITLSLSFLILNNYFLLSVNSPLIFIKVNLLIFFSVLFLFYFKDLKENIYLKIFILVIIFISLGTPTYEWDPRSIWLFHGKRIFYDGTIFSVKDNYAAFSHNDYPNLIPSLSSSLATLVGNWNEVFPKIAFTLAFIPPLILTYVFIRDTYYIIFLSLVLFIVGKYLFSGWADGLLAVYFTLSSLLFYIIFFSNLYNYKNNYLTNLIGICFIITLTLIKNEGFVLALIIFASTFIIKLLNKNLKKNIKKLLILSFSFIPIILWKIFCYRNGLINDHINLSILSNLSNRIYDIYNYKQIFYFLFLNEKFIFSFLFFLFSFIFVKNRELFKFVLLISIIYFTLLFLIYLSTPYDFYFQLNSSAARIVKSCSFLLGFFALYNLSSKNTSI
tara:strand:+ start:23672 stop:24856 length:1185 start_codon:yes stop_codon:yes gene_type:complete